MPTGVFDIDGVKVHYREEGAGAPVLLLHGMGASSYSWRHLQPALAGRFKTYAIDWPGYGRSDKPWDYDYSPQGYARLLLGIMDRLGVKKAPLIGNSMGGLCALRTALDHPDRVDRLVLIGTPTYPGDRPAILWPLRWPVIGSVYERALGPWAVPIVARSAFFDKALVTPELIAEYGAALKTREGPRAVAQFLRRAVPDRVEEYLRRYKDMPQPVLIIRGRHDGVVGGESVERFAKEVPRSRLLQIERCGHAPQEERPEIVGPAVLEFLA